MGKESLNIQIDKIRLNHVTHHSQIDRLLLPSLTECVRSSFGGGVTDEDIHSHLQGDIVNIYLNPMSKDVLAFSSTSFGTPNQIFERDDLSDELGCYFSGAAVSSSSRGLGLYNKLIENELMKLQNEDSHAF